MGSRAYAASLRTTVNFTPPTVNSMLPSSGRAKSAVAVGFIRKSMFSWSLIPVFQSRDSALSPT